MVRIVGGRDLEHALDGIARSLGVGTKKVLRVGFLEGATYPGGSVKNRAGKTVQTSDVNVATVAAAQEFGTSTIPARPFFRTMVSNKEREWGPAAAKLLKANDYDVDRTLNQVGMGIKGQLQQSILDTNAPALAASTIKAKGFDKPLIDTGHMINSVDYEIVDEL